MINLSLESWVNKSIGESLYKTREEKEKSSHILIKDLNLDATETKTYQSFLKSVKITEIALGFFAGTLLFIFANNRAFNRGYENGYENGHEDGLKNEIIKKLSNLLTEKENQNRRLDILQDEYIKCNKAFYIFTAVITVVGLLYKGPLAPRA